MDEFEFKNDHLQKVQIFTLLSRPHNSIKRIEGFLEIIYSKSYLVISLDL